jgi:lysophospholipid acyltransferase (LPLAT)-like uncharacterized protein
MGVVARAVAAALFGPFRLLAASWRYRALEADGARLDPRAYAFPPEILAVSERDVLALAGLCRLRRFAVLVAPGRDGDWASELLAASGLVVVRGALGRGGEPALRALRDQLAADPVPLVLAVDGPLGPAGVARGGAALLARWSGRAILPLAAAARPAVAVPGTWARMLLPLPGARVVLAAGERLRVAPAATASELERHTTELTAALATARERARREVG